MTSARRPSVLAYKAVRDASTIDDAKAVYAAMQASACYPVDACALDGACPFYVDCATVEGGTEDT